MLILTQNPFFITNHIKIYNINSLYFFMRNLRNTLLCYNHGYESDTYTTFYAIFCAAYLASLCDTILLHASRRAQAMGWDDNAGFGFAYDGGGRFWSANIAKIKPKSYTKSTPKSCPKSRTKYLRFYAKLGCWHFFGAKLYEPR